MQEVRIYVTTRCPYCVMAKRLLESREIPYTSIDVTTDVETRQWLVEVSRQRTVPQIFIGERSIGGYDELSALDRAGKLDALLQAPAS